jgi:transposase
MQQLEGKTLEQKKAAEMLRISESLVRRLLRAYRRSGVEGLISKRRGQPSNNQLKEEVKQQAIDLIYSQYHVIGPTFTHEKLTEQPYAQVHDYQTVDDQDSLMLERC